MKMPRTSLRDRAYDAIKHRIITLRYRPGEYLNEARICEDLDIGRTPVHQALDRLMLDGMVQVIPRKGVIVKPVSLDEVRALSEVRLVCETAAARLAAQRATGEDIEHLRSVLGRTDAVVAARDLEGMMFLDRDFHGGLAQAAHNPVLAEFLRTLCDRHMRFWFMSLSARDQMARACGEHIAVFDAIERGDPEAAEAAARRHIESFRNNVTRLI